MKALLTGHSTRMPMLPGLVRSSTVSPRSPEAPPAGGILDTALATGVLRAPWPRRRSRRHPSDRSCIHMTKGTEIRYRVRGGTPLQGTVFVQGAKNAALKMIAAALLTDQGRPVLRNVPPIEDVRRAVELAQALGARVEFHETERTLVVDAATLTSPVLPAEIARRFRGSVLFVPALLHRFGEAVIEGVGGCNLGSRNLDFHYRGFARLGAVVDEGETVIRIKAGNLQGAHLYLDTPS